MKNILIILDTTHGEIGGTEQNSLRFAQALKRGGFFPHIVEVGKPILQKSSDSAGLIIHRIPAENFDDAPIYEFLSILKAVKPSTVIRSKTWIGCINWRIDLAVFASRATYLSWEHHPAPTNDTRDHPKGLGQSWGRKIRLRVKAIARNTIHMRTVSRILCVSNAVREPLIQYHRISPRKTQTIYPGVDFDIFCRIDSARKEVRNRWQIPESAFVIGSMGRLAAHKGNDFSLDVMAELRRKTPHLDVWCVFAGQGSDLERLKNLADKLGIADRVRFPGWQSSAPEAWNAFDIFLMPSSDEGLGMTLIEATACGCLVLGADVGGMKEILVGPLESYCLPPANTNVWTEKIAQIALIPPSERGKAWSQAYKALSENFEAKRQWSLMTNWVTESSYW